MIEYWVSVDDDQLDMPSNIGPIPWDKAEGDGILGQC